ncbi:MAG: YidC/Oxa1 family membrane protein insertase [Patescibacteria group bacterium]
MSGFFHTFLYAPIYNLLVFLISIVPGGDIGIAVILATLIVKIILLPLSLSAARTQKAMKAIEPELKVLRETLKDDKEKQAREMFALYKKYGVKPFTSILTLLIQLPIFIGLYWVFSTETLPKIDISILYPFVHEPLVAASTIFLGLISVTGHSLVLAGIAGVTQLIQAWYAIPVPPASAEVGGSPGEDFARAMTLQARYVLPLIIAFVAYTSGAIALYFITSNVVALAQEWIVRQGKDIVPVVA